jgi:glycosyltransferase involved in cell wall biosynthesis
VNAKPQARLSVVVPCYNEADNLGNLVAALGCGRAAVTEDYELLLVDDGSTDGTLPLLRRAARRDARVRYLALSRNFGKEAAMLAGLRRATGRAVALMDADLQHPPELLRRMLPLLDQGYDQVVARRNRAGDSRGRTLASTAYYRLVNRMVDVTLENGVGDFRMLSRKAVDALLALEESNRFSKGLFAWIGFDTAVVDYDNVARAAGASKWRIRDLFNYGIDSVLSFNVRPLRLAIHIGTTVAAIAILYSLWVFLDAAVRGVAVPGYVTTICAVLVLGGLQMMMLGVVGEYLGRIYVESKQRPHYLVKESSDDRAIRGTVPSPGPCRDTSTREPTARETTATSTAGGRAAG